MNHLIAGFKPGFARDRCQRLTFAPGRTLQAPERWPVARVMAGEQFSAMVVRVRRKDDGRTWFGSYSGTPVRDKASSGRIASCD